MASKATMVGGVIINATTFVGESYLEKYDLDHDHDHDHDLNQDPVKKLFEKEVD